MRGSFWSLVRLTCVEIPRQPAVLLLTTTLIVFIGALPFLITHNLGEAGKLTRDSALAAMFLGSLLLAVPSVCNAVSHEIRRGTAGAILSKPIGRFRFLIAKYVGVSIVMLTFSMLASISVIISDRAAAQAYRVGWTYIIILFAAVVLTYLAAALMNFATGRPFVSTAFWTLVPMLLLALLLCWLLTGMGSSPSADPDVVQAPSLLEVPLRWSLVPACLCLSLAALMIQALALLFALKLGVVPTLSACTGFFLLGLISDYLLANRAVETLWARVVYTLLPNWQHFWMADALTGGGSIPWAYVGQAASYALIWTLGLLLLAMGLFERMEVNA